MGNLYFKIVFHHFYLSTCSIVVFNNYKHIFSRPFFYSTLSANSHTPILTLIYIIKNNLTKSYFSLIINTDIELCITLDLNAFFS